MLNWADVYTVVKTIIENDIHLEVIEKDDSYSIEKATDTVFTEVRKRQLAEE